MSDATSGSSVDTGRETEECPGSTDLFVWLLPVEADSEEWFAGFSVEWLGVFLLRKESDSGSCPGGCERLILVPFGDFQETDVCPYFKKLYVQKGPGDKEI